MSSSSRLCPCWARVCEVMAKWLARWAKSAAVKSWMGFAFGSAGGVSSFSMIGALYFLSDTRILWSKDLTWNRHMACFNCHRGVVFHVGFLLFTWYSSCAVSIVRRLVLVLRRWVPRSIFIMNFGNTIVTTPVVGEAGSLRPAVDASTIVWPMMPLKRNSAWRFLWIPYWSTSVIIKRLSWPEWEGGMTSLKIWVWSTRWFWDISDCNGYASIGGPDGFEDGKGTGGTVAVWP